jgi:hypothetical protein
MAVADRAAVDRTAAEAEDHVVAGGRTAAEAVAAAEAVRLTAVNLASKHSEFQGLLRRTGLFFAMPSMFGSERVKVRTRVYVGVAGEDGNPSPDADSISGSPWMAKPSRNSFVHLGLYPVAA